MDFELTKSQKEILKAADCGVLGAKSIGNNDIF